MCEPMTITMMVMAVAMAVKTSMDAKKAAAVQRKNAIAQQKLEQEALLKKRAEQGDKNAMEMFEKARGARVEEAKIRVATGEQGASSGSFQMDNMLQGLGFSTGLQQAADERSAGAEAANTELQMRASGIGFQNQMRTINSRDPSGMQVIANGAMAAGNAYAANGGSLGGGGSGGGVPNQGTGGQVSRINVGR